VDDDAGKSDLDGLSIAQIGGECKRRRKENAEWGEKMNNEQ
jgi:hypothetical protein